MPREFNFNPALAIAIVLGVLVLLAAILGGVLGSEPEPQSSVPPPTSAPTVDFDKVRGEHCLNWWDDNHDGMEALIRERLHDPGSMETIKTVMKAARFGEHPTYLHFSAKNAFGGRVRHVAYGKVDNVTCSATLIRIDPFDGT